MRGNREGTLHKRDKRARVRASMRRTRAPRGRKGSTSSRWGGSDGARPPSAATRASWSRAECGRRQRGVQQPAVQPAALRHHATRSTQHATCNTRHGPNPTTDDGRRATRNRQHATCNGQHATFNTQQTTDDVRQGACDAQISCSPREGLASLLRMALGGAPGAKPGLWSDQADAATALQHELADIAGGDVAPENQYAPLGEPCVVDEHRVLWSEGRATSNVQHATDRMPRATCGMPRVHVAPRCVADEHSCPLVGGAAQRGSAQLSAACARYRPCLCTAAQEHARMRPPMCARARTRAYSRITSAQLATVRRSTSAVLEARDETD